MRAKQVNYCDIVNFKNPYILNPEGTLLYEAVKSQQKGTKNRKCIKFHQSNLQISALSKIKQNRQRQQAQAISDIISLDSSSNFIFSRQNTPANHNFPKKKNKNRTVGSDLFDIQSKGSLDDKDQNLFDDLILYPKLIGLSEAIYAEVMGQQKRFNPKLIHSWQNCLLPEDKQSIYGKNAPYSFPRVFPVNELEKGLNQVYGEGKNRCLHAGEESLLMHHMQKYLEKCNKDIIKIARKDYDILSDIFKSAKLVEIEQLPVCMKQTEILWKALATQWRYSGKLDYSNKLLQSALINGKFNFLDLKKHSSIVEFLLGNSNVVNQKKKQI